MITEPAGRSLRGRPAWLRAATIGLIVCASTMLALHIGKPPLDSVSADPRAEDLGAEDGAPEPVPSRQVVPSRGRPTTRLVSHGADLPRIETPPDAAPDGMAASIGRARSLLADCKARYDAIRDYSCVFHKRERIDGTLLEPNVMAMKVRTRPAGLYFKFVQPGPGREVIFEPARNGGKILVHDVGVAKLLAGTMRLDPAGAMAMEENRHPVTEAGIGMLILTVSERWRTELDAEESLVEIHPVAKVGQRPCTMVESTHPARRDGFFFYRVKLFIDQEHGLPIRYEAYDWPRTAGAEPELVEEYTYADLKTDVGLSDVDFDPSNPRYSFGRF